MGQQMRARRGNAVAMIVSVSRRTDIPACYADWFLGRIAEGYALVRNPMNAHQMRRVDLSPEAVHGFVFWSKNPAPMLDKLDALAAYPYYFQFTLNPYGPDVEPGLPPLTQRVSTFCALSERIGRERTIWRYDPILITPKYDMRFHMEQFETLARSLAGYADLCTISFLDFYPKIAAAIRELAVVEPLPEQRLTLAMRFAEIAAACGLRIETCAEDMDYSGLGIGRARCVGAERLARIAGRPVKAPKDKNQRPACDCAASVDIGTYDTCPHGCRYCYANRGEKTVRHNRYAYDIVSPLLCGQPDSGQGTIVPADTPKEPKQLRIFE